MTPKPIDAEALLARLRRRVPCRASRPYKSEATQPLNPDGPEAADLITTQSKEIAALKQRVEELEGALKDIASIDRVFIEANGVDGAFEKIIDRARTALAQASETSK